VRTSVKPSAADKRSRIEAAALTLFTKQGFHGTNTREIAVRAGVSTIYPYFHSKEALFAALVEKHRALFVEWFRMAVGSLQDPLTPRSLRTLASSIRARMKQDPEYFLLVFVDLVEFKNRHYRTSFSDTPQWFRRVLGPALEKVRERPGWCGLDPAFVLAAVYRYFVHFGLIEQQMGGHRYLGVSSDRAARRVIDLLATGLWQAPPAGSQDPWPRFPVQRKPPDESAQYRIDFIRLLSGRFWSDRQKDGAGRSHRATAPLLFLPRVTGLRADDTQLMIEAAALELFTTQGFHGTNIREIAEKAGISQGAIYTYYPSKERIFEQLVATYRGCMTSLLGRILLMPDDPFHRTG
jgi:AcrR family transcriptional regulator